MRITVETNFPQIQRRLNTLQRDIADTVMLRSLNRTIDIARTDMNRRIRSEFNVTASFVRERLSITKARRVGSAIQLEAVLRATARGRQKRGANVIAFSAKQTKKGVTVKIKKRGPRRLIKDAFIGNKGRTVFARVPGTTMQSRARYRNKHGEKIKGVTTIDIPQMFNTRRIKSAVTRVIEDRFPAVFERELRFAVSKFERGAR